MNLEYIFYIHASTENVWSILTQPEKTSAIFYGAKVSSTFEVGQNIQYLGPGRDGEKTLHMYGKVLEYIPLNKLVHTIQVGEVYRNGTRPFTSRVSYALEDCGFAVKLTVRQDQWHKDDPSYQATKEGWWLMLSNIKSLAETGIPLNIGHHQ